MKRDDFFTLLSEKISPLPAEERNKLYEYYNEIILDKKDAGIDEDTIIASFGDIDEIAARVLSEYPELKAGQQPVYHQQPVMPPESAFHPKATLGCGQCTDHDRIDSGFPCLAVVDSGSLQLFSCPSSSRQPHLLSPFG